MAERSQTDCKLCELEELTWSLGSWREEAEALGQMDRGGRVQG